jgi:hypothetical protein
MEGNISFHEQPDFLAYIGAGEADILFMLKYCKKLPE